MPNYTSSLRLEKPLQNENYNVDVFNGNADILDNAIKTVNARIDNIGTQVDGLQLKAEKVSIADKNNVFTSTNVEGALAENRASISTMQSTVNSHSSSISALQTEVNGQRSRGIKIANALIDKLEG